MAQSKLIHYRIHNAKLARKLNYPAHISQVQLKGYFPSAAAFVRTLISDGLDFGSESSILRDLRSYGSVNPEKSIPEPYIEGVIYVDANEAGRPNWVDPRNLSEQTDEERIRQARVEIDTILPSLDLAQTLAVLRRARSIQDRTADA